MAIQHELEQTIHELWDLERGTTSLCQEAKSFFRTRELKQTLRDYSSMHEDHLNELERIFHKNNIPLPLERNKLPAKIHHTLAIVQSAFGERNALKAIKRLEERNISFYTKALRNVVEK